MPENQIIFTINEAACYLRVHPSTIRRHIDSGGIPAFRVGSAWRLDKESIDKWKREQENSNCRLRRGDKNG